jgi:hypothetical protein
MAWDGPTANALLLACGRAKDAERAVRVAERCGSIVLSKEVRITKSNNPSLSEPSYNPI